MLPLSYLYCWLCLWAFLYHRFCRGGWVWGLVEPVRGLVQPMETPPPLSFSALSLPVVLSSPFFLFLAPASLVDACFSFSAFNGAAAELVITSMADSRFSGITMPVRGWDMDDPGTGMSSIGWEPIESTNWVHSKTGPARAGAAGGLDRVWSTSSVVGVAGTRAGAGLSSMTSMTSPAAWGPAG